MTITNNDDSSINNVASNSSASKPLPVNTTSLVDHECDCPLSRRIGPVPHKIPGKKWVPAWTLHDEEKSFEERILNKMVSSSGSKKQVKRRKFDLKTKVITNDQLLAELKRKELEDKEKEERKLERKRKAENRKEKKVEKQKTKKKIKMDYRIESDENDVVLEEERTEEEIISDYEEERNERNNISDKQKINEDNDSDDLADLLKKVWEGISPPTPEDEVAKGWYGAKRKKFLFVRWESY